MRFVLLGLVLSGCGGSAVADPDATVIDANSDVEASASASISDCDASLADWSGTGFGKPGWACGTCYTDSVNDIPRCLDRNLACKYGQPIYCPCGYSGLPYPCCDPCSDAGFVSIVCDETAHQWRCPKGLVACATKPACSDAGSD